MIVFHYHLIFGRQFYVVRLGSNLGCSPCKNIYSVRCYGFRLSLTRSLKLRGLLQTQGFEPHPKECTNPFRLLMLLEQKVRITTCT